jgi:hypothetical protein
MLRQEKPLAETETSVAIIPKHLVGLGHGPRPVHSQPCQKKKNKKGCGKEKENMTL